MQRLQETQRLARGIIGQLAAAERERRLLQALAHLLQVFGGDVAGVVPPAEQQQRDGVFPHRAEEAEHRAVGDGLVGRQVAWAQVRPYDRGHEAHVVAREAQALHYVLAHHRAGLLVAEEAQPAVYQRGLGRLGHVVQQCGQLEDLGPADVGMLLQLGMLMDVGREIGEERIHPFHHAQRVLEHPAFAVIDHRAFFLRYQFGEDLEEQPGLAQRGQPLVRLRAFEQAHQFLAHPFGGGVLYQRGLFLYGFEQRGRKLEVQRGGYAESAQQAQRVLFEHRGRGLAYAAGGGVGQAAAEVDDLLPVQRQREPAGKAVLRQRRVRLQPEGQRVQREIAAFKVRFQRAALERGYVELEGRLGTRGEAPDLGFPVELEAGGVERLGQARYPGLEVTAGRHGEVEVGEGPLEGGVPQRAPHQIGFAEYADDA